MSIEKEVVVITGASRGIGRQLAIDCAAAGYAVVVNYRSDRDTATTLVAEIASSGGTAHPIGADVADADGVVRLIEGSLKAFGRLDAVVNNAGSGAVRMLDELDAREFSEVLANNLVSSFQVSQAAIPHLKARGGRLIFMSSGAAATGGKVSAAYAASKAGIEGLMHYYATYLAPHRITANAIAPSLIETDMLKDMEISAASLPLGRLGRADEVWPLVRMILESGYMTGQTIRLNAGQYMT